MTLTNPLDLLKNDHQTVKNLLKEYKSLRFEEKKDKADKICEEVAIHMGLEEELFYPEIRQISQEAEDLISESITEHNEVRTFIKNIGRSDDEVDLDLNIEAMESALYDHIEEEEDEIFALAEENIEDRFAAMQVKMMAYKAENKGKIMLQKISEMAE